MIQQATYSDGSRTATIKVERIDTWLEATDTILNFPGLVELDGDRLYLTVHRARHGAPEGEPLGSMVSEDGGRTWREAPADFPLIDRHPVTGENYVDFSSGVLGYLRDGSSARIDTFTVEASQRERDRRLGPFHLQMQQHEATFRWRRWARNTKPIESFTFKVEGMPWTTTASYENYASLLELDNGELLTVLEAQVGPPEQLGERDGRGRPRWRWNFTPFVVRSADRGHSWRFVTAFNTALMPAVYGVGDRPVDEGYGEADLAVLANGDLLCVMRTGSYAPMFQSRSTDGGRTWSTPINTGWPGVKPRVELLPNGVLACAAGRGAYGHPQVTHVMLSLDGTGQHWEYPFAFHTGPGCSYTSTMQRDGKLHVVYSHSDFTREMGTHGLRSQCIKRAVLDVHVEPE